MTSSSASPTNKNRSALARAIAFFLFALLFLVPTIAPTDAAWDGESSAEPALADGWYEIGTPEQLSCFRDWVSEGKSVDQKYRLTNHIDLGGKGWAPIGNSSGISFKGIFDGNGFTIRNFKLQYRRDMLNYGLFGYISANARIENLGITGFYINVAFQGSNSGKLGALVGHATANTTIENCFAIGDVIASTAQGFNVGGLIGHAYGTVSNVYFSGIVSLDVSANAAANAGGIAGTLERTLSSSYASGNVHVKSTATTMDTNAGGIVGKTVTIGTIANCHSFSAISGESTLSYVGGVIGQHASNAGYSISTSYAYGSVANGTYQGGVAGRNRVDAGVKNCDFLYNGTNTGVGLDGNNIGISHARSLDASEFREQMTFENQGWNFGDVWTYTSLDQGERPRLRAFFVDEQTIKPDFIVLNPPELTAREGQAAQVTIAISDFAVGNSLSFDGHAVLSRDGITISEATTNGTFVVSTDAELVGSILDVEIGIPVGDTIQKKTYRIHTEGSLRITTTVLPDGVEGKTYEALIQTANANGTVVFSPAGDLPEGVSLDIVAGKLFGTPTQPGVFSFAVTASDDRKIVSRDLTLTIAKKSAETGGGQPEEQPEKPSQPDRPNQPDQPDQEETPITPETPEEQPDEDETDKSSGITSSGCASGAFTPNIFGILFLVFFADPRKRIPFL